MRTVLQFLFLTLAVLSNVIAGFFWNPTIASEFAMNIFVFSIPFIILSILTNKLLDHNREIFDVINVLGIIGWIALLSYSYFAMTISDVSMPLMTVVVLLLLSGILYVGSVVAALAEL